MPPGHPYPGATGAWIEAQSASALFAAWRASIEDGRCTASTTYCPISCRSRTVTGPLDSNTSPASSWTLARLWSTLAREVQMATFADVCGRPLPPHAATPDAATRTADTAVEDLTFMVFHL